MAQIKASMWMCQDFPLTLEHVTPMLEILSMQVSWNVMRDIMYLGVLDHLSCWIQPSLPKATSHQPCCRNGVRKCEVIDSTAIEYLINSTALEIKLARGTMHEQRSVDIGGTEEEGKETRDELPKFPQCNKGDYENGSI